METQYKYDHNEDILYFSVDGGRRWRYKLDSTGQPKYNEYEEKLLNMERETYREAEERWVEEYIERQSDPDYWSNYLHNNLDGLDENQVAIIKDLSNETNSGLIKEIHNEENIVKLDANNKYFTIGENGKRFEPVLMGDDINTNYIKTFNDGQFFYFYDNGVYKPNADKMIRKIAQEMLGKESRKSRIEEVVYWLSNENFIHNQSQINPNDGYINVKNGLLNWRTGELVKHKSDRLSTIQFNVSYDPKANDPIIMQFINDVLDKDTHMTLFEMIGYFLVPTVEYEKIFLFTGKGANGKSKLILTILELLGRSNVSNVKIQDLEGQNSRFKIAELQNKVVNAFTDIPSDALKTTGNLKAIASGESFNAERKNRDPFNFQPFSKLLFSANELPRSYDNSDAFFRRMMVFPFTRQFTGQNADTKILEKLTTPNALSTLLNYAIEGLRRLDKQGSFTYSETLDNQVKEYQTDSDIIMQFWNEYYIKSDDENDRLSCANVYQKYQFWCKENGLQPFSSINFNKHIQVKFNTNKQKKKVKGYSQNCWIGFKSC